MRQVLVAWSLLVAGCSGDPGPAGPPGPPGESAPDPGPYKGVWMLEPGDFNFSGFVLLADRHVTVWLLTGDIGACCQPDPDVILCPDFIGPGQLAVIEGETLFAAANPLVSILGRWRGPENVTLDLRVTNHACGDREFTISATRIAKKPTVEASAHAGSKRVNFHD